MRRALITGVLIALPDVILAHGICTQIKSLVPLALENFEVADVLTPPPAMEGAESCSTSRTISGANGFHCAWGYPYRDDAAIAAFEAFDAALAGCVGDAGPTLDQGVNHPDTYDLRQYQLGDVTVSVSLKDKGALQRSFVFIALQGVAPK